ncbi:MAG: hypothetical protein ACXW0F_11805 [Gaiellaceae bacterium]
MPDAQTFPHVPQLLASKRMSTHFPLQQVCDPSTALFWQHVMDAPDPQTSLAR